MRASIQPIRTQGGRRRWHTLSLDTVRAAVIFLIVLAVIASGAFAYVSWQTGQAKKEAARVIDECRGLIQRVQGEKGAGLFREEYNLAWQSFQTARGEYSRERYRPALGKAREGRDLLVSILDALKNRGAVGEAQFIAVQGEVEYRRSDLTGWKQARKRIMLRTGDSVRTSGNGSAEIMFLDGTLYVIRPNTQVVVARNRSEDGKRGQQAMRMEYGWVNLNTSQRPSRVETPAAEATIDQESEAFVSFEKGSKRGLFGAYRGALEVAFQGGEKRRVSELRQLEDRAGTVSEALLPAAPELTAPVDNSEINFDQVRELALAWEPTPAARSYALQISRNHLFVDNVIDVSGRRKVGARLGIKGEGTFLWRVSAIGENGARGPWSPVQRFRVASRLGVGEEKDDTPPDLAIGEVTPYGNIFIVEGRAEPGSQVTVNTEPVKVAADGTFTKTIQLVDVGLSSLRVRARDAWGNESVENRQVFVEDQ